MKGKTTHGMAEMQCHATQLHPTAKKTQLDRASDDHRRTANCNQQADCHGST